jgi:hypothetical protein
MTRFVVGYDAVGTKRGCVARFSATLKGSRERPNASQVRDVCQFNWSFQDQSDYRPQELLGSPARRHGNF